MTTLKELFKTEFLRLRKVKKKPQDETRLNFQSRVAVSSGVTVAGSAATAIRGVSL